MMTNTEFLERYALLPYGSHVVCALSGGRDSVYLLCRLLDVATDRGLTVSAAHYNHHLRGKESERDEAFVQQLCAEKNVQLYTGGCDVAEYAEKEKLGIEEAARNLRYAFLENVRRKIGADLIATAHHADDLAETMLLQLVRGSGAKGLSGIPPRRGNIVRPILLTTRQEIDGYLSEHGIDYVDDSSNETDFCTRNRIRHHVMPILQELNVGFVQHAARAALMLREDDAYIQKQADLFLTEHPAENGIDTAALAALEDPVASRVVRTVWGSGLSYEHVRQILALCDGDGLAFTHIPGYVVRRDAGKLWTDGAISVPNPVCLNGEQGTVEFGDYWIRWKMMVFSTEIHNSFNTFYLKYENIIGVVTVSVRQSGDSIKLIGSNHSKRLKKLYSERKLTQPERVSLPVIRDEAGVAAVYGFGIAQRLVPEIGERVLCIMCEKKRENGG